MFVNCLLLYKNTGIPFRKEKKKRKEKKRNSKEKRVKLTVHEYFIAMTTKRVSMQPRNLIGRYMQRSVSRLKGEVYLL
jgi:hypothetical protein